MTSDDYLAAVVDHLGKLLKPFGYRRKGGRTFMAQRPDVLLLINVQKGSATTPDTLVFTINLGIFCQRVEDNLGHGGYVKPDPFTCHWRKRLGWLLDPPGDRWWQVSSSEETEKIARQIATFVEKRAVPALEDVSSIDKLRAVWLDPESSAMSGLTDLQRKDYLAALEGPI
jgi:Domain of unknown function (DUF4304)